jgi:hypothetical protein
VFQHAMCHWKIGFQKINIFHYYGKWHQLIGIKHKWTQLICHMAICYFSMCHILRPFRMNDVDIFKMNVFNIINIATWQHIICSMGDQISCMVSHKWQYKYSKSKDQIVFLWIFLHPQSMLFVTIVLYILSKAIKRVLVVNIDYNFKLITNNMQKKVFSISAWQNMAKLNQLD